MTFKKYAKQKKLMDKESIEISLLSEIDFYSFDFRSANLFFRVLKALFYFSFSARICAITSFNVEMSSRPGISLPLIM